MAEWKVSREKLELFPHPGADKLEIGKLGAHQVVVQKGLYEDGQVVIFVPERSILPPLLAEPFRAYLRGPERDRVGSVRLRGELSMGVILPDVSFEEMPLGEDVSAVMGITKYEPPIPTELAGEIEPMPAVPHFRHHDVEQFRIYGREFVEGEEVLAFEKVHGSLVTGVLTPDGDPLVTSKGMAKRGLAIKRSSTNAYWRGSDNVGLFDMITNEFDASSTVQAFGEVIPVQGGYSYGQPEHTIRFFKLVVDGRILPYDELPACFRERWVPLPYRGPYDPVLLAELAKGNETVSGRGVHIREGIVVSPVVPRRSREGFDLMLKIINPAYRDDPESFS